MDEGSGNHPKASEVDPELKNWIALVANAFDIPVPDDGEAGLLLDIAGVLAHGSHRRQLAPIGTFLIGLVAAQNSTENRYASILAAKEKIEAALSSESTTGRS